MELIAYLILIGLALYLIYLLVRYVILPIASVLSGIVLTISAGYALYVSIISFAKSIKDHVDPYANYVDAHADLAAGVRKNYCFGPGFHQIAEIVKGAFNNLAEYRKKLTAWKDKMKRGTWFIDMWIYLGYGFAIFCAQFLGCIWVGVFSTLLATGISVGVAGFFLFFSTLWLIDRIVLLFKSIHNRCPSCKRISVIPAFVCPTCGAEHKKLVPGPYGVIKRKCVCGTPLATTFIGGRSEYEAHCPFCDMELYSSQSQQYGIQLVGGVGTGKTTFLAAFWHEYQEWLNQHRIISYQEIPREAFENLEFWFQNGTAEATVETNANMYSIIHTIGENTPVQMTIYDIAGEAFAQSGSELQQQQFRYCEGFLIVIDPTASPDSVSESVANFINSMEEVNGRHTAKTASVPAAIIITKSDLYKREIGLPRIRSLFTPVFGSDNALAFAHHRDDICRKFLEEHGYSNAVNLIESEFANARYFPVSAMGHSMEPGHYEPWGVLDPVFWLMNNDLCPLQCIVKS